MVKPGSKSTREMSNPHLRTAPKLLISILSGVSVFLAFEKIGIVPLIILFPIFFNHLSFSPDKLKNCFLWGFFTSFIIMLGGFYWVTYVLHEFGYLPWPVATLLFLAFCGFGALNFPVFTLISCVIHRRIGWQKLSPSQIGIWFSVGLPALFTLIEFSIPKLFPWMIGHSLYQYTYLIQIVEFTGCTYLSFMLYSLGSTLGLLLYPPLKLQTKPWVFLAIPCVLILVSLFFSFFRIAEYQKSAGNFAPFKVAVIQANIGSLEKMQSEVSGGSLIDQVINRYEKLTNDALKEQASPHLIIWPETALPFAMNGNERRAQQIKTLVTGWNIPLITGSYAQSPLDVNKDYNAAYLLEPLSDGTIKTQNYLKNILLAFGEYLPLGKFIPIAYKYFPQIAEFDRGQEQNPLTLKDGTRLGITICYEAIVPSFYRKTASHPINAVINLTNDSWFGPTSEPFLHGSLTIFRAVESRVPLIRVTNTGTSFGVDSLGRQTVQTEIFKPTFLNLNLLIPKSPPHTWYIQYGEWFAMILAAGFFGCLILIRKAYVSFSD